MEDWYGPPVAIHGVPGEVYACGDGDFIGECRAGFEATVWDRGRDLARKLQRAARIATRPRRAVLHAGFATLQELLSEAGSKRQEFPFNMPSSGSGYAVAGLCVSSWRATASSGLIPPNGAAASAAAAGDVPVNTTTGAFQFQNASVSGDFSHFTGGSLIAVNAAGNFGGQLLVYDRIFHVAKTMNNTGTEAVTGVPTRYQSTTATDPDYCGGNFLFIEVSTVLANTGHNWTVCQYQNQSGSGTATLPSVTGNAAALVGRLDHPVWQWFTPLAAGDIGVKKLTQMQCSALVATGAINFVIGHPIAWLPAPLPGMVCEVGGIITSFNMARVFDNAALSLIEVHSGSSQVSYTGNFTVVSG
jgi:hypothetical protein